MKAFRLIPVIALLILIVSVAGAQDMMYNEAPMNLPIWLLRVICPPVEERLPSEPLVVEPNESIGKYGGTSGAWECAVVAIARFIDPYPRL